MKPTLGVFGFGQFMEFFTPYLEPFFEIKVYDRSGGGEKILKTGAKPVSFEEAASCSFVLLGYPASYIEDLVKKIAPYIKKEVVVFDICSVKTPAVEAMIKYLPKHCHIIGTHPVFGPQSGKNGIKGLKMTFTDITSDRGVFEEFKNIFSEKLKLEVFEMTIQQHDKEMAYIQGITHFIGRTLKQMAIPDAVLATTSYSHLRETSELVGYDSDDLFLSIQLDNPYVKEAREALLTEIVSLDDWVQENTKK